MSTSDRPGKSAAYERKRRREMGIPDRVTVAGPVHRVEVYQRGQVLTKVDPDKYYYNASIQLEGANQTVNAKDCLIHGTRITVSGTGNIVIGDECTINGSSNRVLGDNVTLNGTGSVLVGKSATLNGSGHHLTVDGYVNQINGAGHKVVALGVTYVHGAGHDIRSVTPPVHIHGVGHKTSILQPAALQTAAEAASHVILQAATNRAESLKKEIPRESATPPHSGPFVFNSSNGTTVTLMSGIPAMSGSNFVNIFSDAGTVIGRTSVGPAVQVVNIADSDDDSKSSSEEESSEEEEKRRHQKKRSKKDPPAAAAPVKPPKLPVEWKQDPIKLKENESGGCAVCLEYRADAMVQPCGHLCMCMACARKIAEPVDAKCPICKQKIEHIQGARLST